MTAQTSSEAPESAPEELGQTLDALEDSGRRHGPRVAVVIGAIAALWSVFQLWIASPLPFIFGFGIIVDVPARGVHLAFGLLLCFLIFPGGRRADEGRIPPQDLLFAVLGAGAALYLFLGYDGLVARQGVLLVQKLSLFGVDVAFPIEAVLGAVGIGLLMEATRRAIGIPLVIVAGVFLLYSIFGQSMPEMISHKGVSLNRLIGYQWLGGESIFGIPIDVSVSFVFLFVLFGALMEKAGAGKYFLDLSFAMVGRFRGGPAKAAILASGMTGAISGSSIANVVTTGTFTIPVMRRMGMPAVKAGAIEVAASTNGQIMPPIMGAAAFIIAEFIGISYFDVVIAALIPAVISYMALFYISHLEAMKLGLRGLPREEIPPFRHTFFAGIHFLIPVVVLIWLLMVERWTAGTAVFYSIILMMVILVVQHAAAAMLEGGARGAGPALIAGLGEVYRGLIAGARNMVSIAVAVAAAGIIVGSVSSTGLNNALVGVVEAISGGNVYVLLVLTAVLCLVLGMGLPTTANYIVVASLLAGVLVELGNASGLILPLIAVHLFVFYFGLMADSTPPVCLAAFAAAAISRADPLKTGVQSFLYDIRTAILPFVFIFNAELLLIGVESVWHGLMVFVVSLIAILCFSSVTQGWMLVKVKLHEALVLIVVIVALFRPGFFMDMIYPPFAEIPFDRFLAGEVEAEPGRMLRLHAVRETPYGDRFKLFLIPTPEAGTAAPKGLYGVVLGQEGDGRYAVTDLAFDGPAERAGLDFGDYVTDVDLEQPGQPPKALVYPFGLALLGLVIAMQYLRWRRRADAAPAASSG
ncbi:MAG TPA: TRAP transporter permease [Rhodospirillales bacterium]|nr:TRAP transporter permease [Rhodospirillales bacterium]